MFSQCDQFLASAFATAQASDRKPNNGNEADHPISAAAALKHSRFALKKSVSGSSGLAGSAETEAGTGSSTSLTTRSQFSMIGSSMLDSARSKVGDGGGNDRDLNGNAGSALTSGPGSVESSAELLLGKKGGYGNDNSDTTNADKVQVRRSWDWRKGWQRGATGEDVLRVLRLNIAKELAQGWMDGDDY